MYTIVYLNTAASVFASRKLYSTLKHRCRSLLRLFIRLKNSRLHRTLRAFVIRYRLRIIIANSQQLFVFKVLMRGGL